MTESNKEQKYPIVDMDEHLSFEGNLSALAQERFAMPPVVVAALRQAGKHAVLKLLQMVESEKFDKLKPQEQLNVISMILDRAYGRAETASSSLSTLHKTGQVMQNSAIGEQLDTIEARMGKRDERLPELKRASLSRPVHYSPAGNDSTSPSEETNDIVSIEDRRARRRLALQATKVS